MRNGPSLPLFVTSLQSDVPGQCKYSPQGDANEREDRAERWVKPGASHADACYAASPPHGCIEQQVADLYAAAILTAAPVRSPPNTALSSIRTFPRFVVPASASKRASVTGDV